jgi:3,4-dihydroxy 2-butanone 4-phosphate synthase/GTP cyclohydrolase II
MTNFNTKFNKPEELIEDIRIGRMVILVDDEDRENEGDIVLAADHVTPEAINFMAREARGLVCLALAAAQIDRLQLPLMVRDESNYSPNKTAFTVSIEASTGVSTGISAGDRAHTIRVASRPEAKPSDIHMPGHIFPIRAQHGGVLRRAGHTEGSVDLAKLAGLNPAAVICEVMKDDGTMARVQDLHDFARHHKIKIGTIVDLIEYRLARDVLVEEVLDVQLPEQFKGYRARVFKSKIDNVEHLLLQKGEIKSDVPTMVRVHLDSFSKDLFSSMAHQESLAHAALRLIDQAGSGLFLLLRGYNKPQGLAKEVRALMGESVQFENDALDYGTGAQILRAVGASKIRLLSSKVSADKSADMSAAAKKQDKRVGLKAYDLEIVEVVSINTDEISELGETLNGIENRSGHFSLQ